MDYKSIAYSKLELEQMTGDLFSDFDRRQEVSQCWRKEHGVWLLKDISFIDDWNKQEYDFLVECLQNTIHSNGTVLGAFHQDILIGFSSLENEPFGSRKQYVQLSNIHIDNRWRGHGIGKKLFGLIADSARNADAKKLYISAHSSKETVAFYHHMGCVDALEINHKLSKKEPCDRQMEYVL